MRFIICDECNGYYKLQEEELLGDFEVCHCGGELRYVQSVHEIVNKPKRPVKCRSCGEENAAGENFCYRCGNILNQTKNSRTRYYMDILDRKEQQRDIIERMDIIGIIVGFVFFRMCLFFLTLMTAGRLISGNSDISGIMGFTTGFLIGAIILMILAGALSAYIGGGRQYIHGFMNGSILGAVLGLYGNRVFSYRYILFICSNTYRLLGYDGVRRIYWCRHPEEIR